MTRDEMRDKLTDYAVGELTPAERAEIERALEADPDLRAELDAIRETVALVSACSAPSIAIKEERLSTERVDAILSRIVTTPKASRRFWVGPAMLAAGVALALGLGVVSNSFLRRDIDRLSASIGDGKAAAERSEDAYKRALTELVGRAGELRTKQGELQRMLILADHELTAADSRFLALNSDYILLVAEQQKLQSNNTDLDKRAENLNAQLAAEKSIREDAQRVRDTVRAELLASNDRLEKAYKDIALLQVKVLDSSKAKNDIEGQLSYLRERVPNIGDLGADPIGEAGLFTREHYGGPSEFYDLRARAVRAINARRELRQQAIDGNRSAEKNANGEGTIGRLIEESSNTAEYNPLVDNPYNRPFDAPLSTFSIDVDTASYANVRRFLTSGQLPPPDAVRLEELVNYFHYGYAAPAGDAPFSVALEAHAAPWEPKHQLVRIGLQGKEIELKDAPAANLVFLVDVSGSMAPAERLPLVKQSLHKLTETLRAQDKVSMVVYAGSSGLVLPATSGAEKATITGAIDRLSSGGSTNGAQGIELAYQVATENFVKDGVNRVVLCTDGDFNVGITDEGSLTRLIEEKRKTGVFLSCLGFGTDNYSDARMQALAQKGNGNAAYIDTVKEAEKVLVEQATGTLITIAKDVKIQVEWNPAKVAAYRLIGYETRLLAAQDFNDDKKDAGEIGAGHQVTALYEVIPAGQEVPASDVDALKYQETAKVIVQGAAAAELCTVKLRFKAPDGDVSRKIEFALADPGLNAAGASTDFEFAASVAAFAMCLRDSEYKGQANFGLVKELAMAGLGDDARGYRKEFVELVKKAAELGEAKKKAAEEKK